MSDLEAVGLLPEGAAAPATLCLSGDLQIQLADGGTLVPKARKARGLLAIVAMSETLAVPRQRIAATLWSNVERPSGLARLRDVLHDLRKQLLEERADFLDLQGETVLFKAGAVVINAMPSAGPLASDPRAKFLTDLEGIDSAFDRWHAHIRAEGRRNQRPPEPANQPGQAAVVPGPREGRPSVVVTELDEAGMAGNARASQALTDELGAALSRLRWFATMTRGVRGQRLSIGSEDLPAIADYALVGTLQCEAAQCRLLVKLIDLRNFGAIEWASSFDQAQPYSLAVQETFANAVAAQLETELLFVEAKRQRQRPPGWREDAYALVLQATPAIHRLERDAFVDAGHLLERAMLLDRESALAHSWMAQWHVFFVGQGWATNPFQSMAQAARAADRAMMLDPKDARAVTVSGHVKAFLTRRLGEAAALHELALQLNPALVLAWHFSGMTHAYAGRLDDALHCILRCRQLAPNAPQAFYPEGELGIVHLLRRDHENAVTVGRRVTERHPNFSSAFKSYLSALGHLGQKAEAASVLQRLLALEPHFSLRRFHATAPYQRKEDLDHFIAGLRLAGVS